MTNQEKIYECIKNFFDKRNKPYEADMLEFIITLPADGNNCIVIYVGEAFVMFEYVRHFDAEDINSNKVAEFLMRKNFGLKKGSICFDNNNFLRCKDTIIAIDRTPSDSEILHSMSVCISVYDYIIKELEEILVAKTEKDIRQKATENLEKTMKQAPWTKPIIEKARAEGMSDVEIMCLID